MKGKNKNSTAHSGTIVCPITHAISYQTKESEFCQRDNTTEFKLIEN